MNVKSCERKSHKPVDEKKPDGAHVSVFAAVVEHDGVEGKGEGPSKEAAIAAASKAAYAALAKKV